MTKPAQPSITGTRLTDHLFPGDDLNAAIKIHADDRDPNNGNASHNYAMWVQYPGEADTAHQEVHFQHGARNEPGSIQGVTDAAVLSIVLDRYRGFQSGPFACRSNAIVITKLEEALMWMQK